MNKKYARKPVVVAISGLFGMATVLAMGLQTAIAQDQVQRVEVTGSSIKRVLSEGSFPIQVLDRSDIDKSGVKSVPELIQSLPAMQGFTVAAESIGGGGAGFASASVHNIGENRTLVLVNGRRLSTWAGQTLTGYSAAIDLNSIPLAAIDRVEILTDGTSALYGSDAVAGVINFILRSNRTDGEVALNYSVPKGNVGKQTTFSVTKGWGDLGKDGFNAMVAFSADKQDRMKATDREFAKTGVIPFSLGGKNYVFFNGSSRTAPATFDVYDPVADTDIVANPPGMIQNGACPPSHVLRGRCRFDYTSTIEIMPESERQNIVGSFSKRLNANHTFSADLLYTKFSLTSRIAPPPVDFQIPTGGALYNQYIGAFGGKAGDELYAFWRGVDAGNRTTEDETKAWHANLTLTGFIGDWDYTAGYTHSTNTWIERYKAGWLSLNELNAAQNSGAWDPFLSPGTQSAAGNAAIANMQFRGEYKREESTLDVLHAKGSREVFKIRGNPAMLGVGIDVRRENVKYSPSGIAMGIGNSIAGDSAAEQPFDVSRNSWGAFGELVTPFTKTFELTSSLRHDHYSDFGNTTNYKFGARFRPAKQYLLRASIGTGFRAPSVPQTSAGKQLYGVTGGTYSCPTAGLAAVQAGDPTAICRVDGSQYDQFAGGNKDLKPEKSDQWSLGFRWEPSAFASFGADWWNVKVKDRMGTLSEDVVMRDSASYTKNFTVFVDPGTGRHYVSVFLPNENLGEEKYSGIDLDGRVQFNSGMGRLTASLNWTHMLKYEYQRAKGGEFFTNLGKYNDDSVTFRNIWRLAVSLRNGNWNHTLTYNYKSGYDDYQCTIDECGLVNLVNADGTNGATVDMTSHRVDAWKTFDWQTEYSYSKALTLTLGIRNVLDEAPPLSIRVSGPHVLGYDPRYADPFQRVIYLNGKFTF